MKNPKITVVTICYNAVNTIEKTILSVINQTYNNIEYIVVDGASTDGTMDIIKKYDDRIAKWVSEPDNGIYDAMNKGIDMATGEWINFMNAGDIFFSCFSISSAFDIVDTISADIIYGYQVHSYKYGKYVRIRLSLDRFRYCMPIGHPSTFVKTSLMKECKFDTNFKIAADYNFFFKKYIEGKKFVAVNAIIADFESSDGVSSSDKGAYTTIIETSIVNGSYNNFGIYYNCFSVAIRKVLKKVIKDIFGEELIESFQKRKRDNNDEYIKLSTFIEQNDYDFNNSSCL